MLVQSRNFLQTHFQSLVTLIVLRSNKYTGYWSEFMSHYGIKFTFLLFEIFYCVIMLLLGKKFYIRLVESLKHKKIHLFKMLQEKT